ncbi:MAG: hypothetical protein HN348_28430 [Proteobacteria bacterium]|nr:hypothetical protein [Pseudomonadota bacterium]
MGTASDPRRIARLVEQAPLFAVRVAAGRGPLIKQLEYRASTSTSAVEGMRRARKLALLRSEMAREEAELRVMDVLADLLQVAGEDYAELFHAPKVLELPPAKAPAAVVRVRIITNAPSEPTQAPTAAC